MGRRKKNDKPFGHINKNVANYPMAWSRKSESWRWTLDSEGWHVGRLSGRINYVIALPPRTPKRLCRPPTAFEVNVLFTLLAMAKMQGSHAITLPSLAFVLRRLKYAPDSENREKLRQAFLYWSKVRVEFKEWYFVEYREKRPYVLDQPIRDCVTTGTIIKIALDPVFVSMQSRFYEEVPLPLPWQEAAQNAVLMLLVAQYIEDAGEDYQMVLRDPRGLKNFMRKMGIKKHGRWKERLASALEAARDWYREYKSLDLMWRVSKDGSKITFKTEPYEAKPVRVRIRDDELQRLKETGGNADVDERNAGGNAGMHAGGNAEGDRGERGYRMRGTQR